MANYTKAIEVPLVARPYCIGKAELMGFVGCADKRTLDKDYLLKGLHWDYRIGTREYYLKESVLQWIADHSDVWTEGTYMRERLMRKEKTCKNNPGCVKRRT